MTLWPPPQDWVPAQVHRHDVRVLRGWVIALAIVVALGGLLLAALTARFVFADSPSPVVASTPRDCRLSDASPSPKLFVAVDVEALLDGHLTDAKPIGASDMRVEGVGVVPTLSSLSSMDDEEFMRLVEEAEEDYLWFGDDESSGVVVAVVDTAGQTEGSVRGLRTRWVLGEPAVQQDLPLGIEFTATSCSVTTAG